ncbi:MULTISPECIES: catalase family peroxidase [Luteimonas]|uniref:catalase family peroxidase n=1 Tax=Luteimonas TaxID=83614 RepID=UPI000C7BB243|nr:MULTISPECIES: catalase family peroxidase [Luteimonas]
MPSVDPPPRTPAARPVGAYLAIAAIVATLALLFAWTAGWLTPQRLTPARMTDAIEGTSPQPYPGFRRAHAKGVCVAGHFEGSEAAAALSKARVLAPGRTPLLGRMSIGGGSPYGLDAQARVRSMALVLRGDDGQEWRMAMNSFPFFGVASIEAFHAQTLASAPDPATGKPDPARMAAFAQAHPESAKFAAWAKSAPWSDSFANTQYNGIHAFRFDDAGGGSRLVRWSMRPQAPFVELPAAQREAAGDDYLQRELQTRLANGPLRWDMVATIAGPGDDSADPSTAWPDDREQVVIGTVVIERAEPQATGPCRDLNFDPTVLPPGVAVSDDPILAARAAVYASSFDRREREIATGAGEAATTGETPVTEGAP